MPTLTLVLKELAIDFWVLIKMEYLDTELRRYIGAEFTLLPLW